jgi:hypothetical protein
MLKKISIVSIVLFSVIFIASVSMSAVVGTWDVVGKAKVRLSIKRAGSNAETTSFIDNFTFDTDGGFSMTDMDGTWSEDSGKFIVYLDPSVLAGSLASELEDMFWSSGYNVNVTILAVTKNSFRGKEAKDGNAISGRYGFSMNFSIYFYDFGTELTGRVNANMNYTGARSSGVSALGKSKSAAGIKSLLDPVAETIMRSVLNDNPDASR